MILKSLAAAIVLVAASSVFAQVEVVDRSPAGVSRMPPPMTTPPPPNNSAQQAGELYYQLQVLQQEVLELRGMIELQAHEIKRLKQQRLDDYLDLDRRLSALGQGKQVTSAGDAVVPEAAQAAPAPEEEIRHYRAAIDLVLKKQQYDTAIVELKKHLATYPQGRYAANATYWLGEIYLLKGELEQSRQWFSQLLADFPGHRKVPDGKFKLGKVYHLMGDEAQARALLNEVAASSTGASKLAKSYLREHFGP
ncbi:YbgF trimerization domain-containing protein [Teredinibacter haidensis]|uniref:YbgF trimerization domain-containing protein n=1 Tax=Teredinibacter haidensis TaxID=2731755 RepID=UPI000B078B4A|nr:YbgF trimerization domain-containing protein [Teredinibacter haidensis]